MSRRKKNHGPKVTLDARLIAKIDAEVEKRWESLPMDQKELLLRAETTRPAVWQHAHDEQSRRARELRNALAHSLGKDEHVDDTDTLAEQARAVMKAQALFDEHRRKDEILSAAFAAEIPALTPPTPAVAHAEGILTLVEAVFSKRVRGEEVGDALEKIHRFKKHRFAHALIYMKVVTTVFWLFVNSIREFTSSVLGKKAE